MAEKLFYTMGEVAEMFDVKTSLIRHWESQFSVLRPKRNKKGNRLFSPGDVENLKVIYHLVKERGMTLEGARKALRKAPAETGVDRDTELMERLQRIRALLVEVREDLKTARGEIVPDSGPLAADAPATEAAETSDDRYFAFDASAAETIGAEPFVAGAPESSAAETAAAPVRRRRSKAVVKFADGADDLPPEPSGSARLSPQKSGTQKSAAQKTAAEALGTDTRPASEQSAAEQSAAGQTAAEQSVSGVPVSSEPVCGEPAPAGPASEQSASEQSAPDQSASEQSVSAMPVSGEPVPAGPALELSASKQSASEHSAAGQSVSGVPASGEPTPAGPVLEQSAAPEPGPDGPSSADSAAGQSARRAARKPRRKKEEAEHKELFAFYEQSLF